MTEAEWLAATDPTPMLAFLRGKVSERKFRLYACGLYRRIWHELTEIEWRTAVEKCELLVDGIIKRHDTAGARRDFRKEAASVDWTSADDAAWAAVNRKAANYHYRQTISGDRAWLKEQCELAYCIFGNPFRFVTGDPGWITSVTLSLATRIYDEKAFDRMPILADALQEAGCDNADILTHCRDDGPHVRGCWVVDLILGKQ